MTLAARDNRCEVDDNSVACTGGVDFSNVPGEPLGTLTTSYSALSHKPLSLGPGEDDLVDVMEVVLDMAAKWKSLGAALRIRHAELNTISARHQNDPIECLRDILCAWLQQHYDHNINGQPSWRILCQAIYKPVGGNNPGLASRIAG